jgi:hypothetical protein
MVLRRRDKEERKASPLGRMRSTIKPTMQSVISSEFSFESDSEMKLSEG